MPTISLCMIVKDEEKLLPRCLKSIKKYVDEIVIVDTGSRDNTVEIAKSYGAQIYRHLWDDDFSKHRNQSIEYASGDWIFIIDADEEIIAPSGELIKKAILDKEIDSVEILVQNVYNQGKSISIHQGIRIFRNHCGIHFEGRVHNRVVGAKKSRFYPIKILHHGYNLDFDKAEEKFQMTTQLLKKEISDNPENPIYHHYLAASYLSTARYEQAAEEGLGALCLAEKDGTINDPFYSWTYYIAGNSLYQLDSLDEAERISLQGLSIFPEELDIYYNLVNIYFKKDEGKNIKRFAEKYFRMKKEIEGNPGRFTHIHAVSFNETWRVHLILGLSLLQGGEHERAESELEHARELINNQGTYYHEIGRYYLKKKEYNQADKYLRLSFDQDKSQIDIIYSLIELAITRKDESNEIFWWKTLLGLFPEKGPDMLREAKKAFSQNRYEDAKKLYAALLSQRPDDNDSLEPYLGLAKITWMERDVEECVALCDQILNKLDIPQDIVLNSVSELGTLYLKIGEKLLKGDDEVLSQIAFEIATEMNAMP